MGACVYMYGSEENVNGFCLATLNLIVLLALSVSRVIGLISELIKSLG